MEYSTYIGGQKDDNPRNLAIDEKGKIILAMQF